MINKLFLKAVCGAIIALLLLSGCNKDVDNGLITSVYMRDKFNQTADTFVQGDEINMTLSIKNDSTSTKTLSFSNNYQYDFLIRDGAGTEIWRWSTLGLTVVNIATSFDLGPTDIQTITYTWNQNIDATPTAIAAGSYTLEANFIGNGPAAQTTLIIQ